MFNKDYEIEKESEFFDRIFKYSNKKNSSLITNFTSKGIN